MRKSLLALFTTLFLAGQLIAAGRPNILYIMSDDHGSQAISAYSGKINRTPNIDRLAKEGMLFTRCFVTNSICTPSRAAILTGKYAHKNGVTVFNSIDPAQPTLAKYLQAEGYCTAMIGKWHLGTQPQGFDFWRVLPGQGVYHDPIFIDKDGRKKYEGYATDIITDFTIEFLKNRPKDKPFFIMCHHKAPHRPWDPDEKHAHLYEDLEIPEPDADTFNDNYATRSPAAAEATMRIDRDMTRRDIKYPQPPAGLTPKELQQWNSTADTQLEVTINGEKKLLTGDALKKWKYQRYLKDYLRCVASIDDNVGRLLDYLEKEGLAENTIVIYTSDQGMYLGEHGWFDKRWMYEESLRMPFLIRWPGEIKPSTTSDGMILNVDFAPTLLDAAHVKIPADMQGRSFLPLLHGERPKDWRTTMYYRYYHYPAHHRVQPHYGVRDDRYKLIYFNKLDAWEFYDLQKDPHELHNLYADADQAGRIKKMKAELERLRVELDDRDQFADQKDTPGL